MKQAQSYKQNYKSIGFTVVLLGLLLSGCGPQQKKTTMGSGRGDRTAVNATAGTNGTVATSGASSAYVKGKWGYVTRGEDDQETFDANIKQFISATIDPEQFGTVSGDIGDTTGMVFNGFIVKKKDGTLDLAASKLSIKIWDSYAGTKEGGKIVPEYPLAFDRLSPDSRLSGDEAALVFEDSYGKVIMHGEAQNDGRFVGKFYFENKKYFDGSPADTVTNLLGEFVVETSGFFDIRK